jgi:hypothetical protein
MKEIIEQIAKALVDNPEQVSASAVPIEGEQSTVFELRVAQSTAVAGAVGVAAGSHPSDRATPRHRIPITALASGPAIPIQNSVRAFGESFSICETPPSANNVMDRTASVLEPITGKSTDYGSRKRP